jgi:hypothetical protein
MIAGHQNAPHHVAALASKRKRRRRYASSQFLRLHRSLHRVSMDRDLRHEAAGQALNRLSGVAVIIAGVVLFLFVLYGLTGGSFVPDPAPQKCICVVPEVR